MDSRNNKGNESQGVYSGHIYQQPETHPASAAAGRDRGTRREAQSRCTARRVPLAR